MTATHEGDPGAGATAAARADEIPPFARPPGRVSRWTGAAGRALATAGVGLLAVLIGLYLLPLFAPERKPANTSLASPESPLPTGPVPSGPAPGQPQTRGPSASPAPRPTRPLRSPQRQPGRPADALARWAQSLSQLGIPQVALQAYGYSELVLTRNQPGCHLSWTLLAGIGSVESNHGRHGGAQLQADGTSRPRIVGVPLDGRTTERIPDTDGGKLDGNAQFDQAMGPMQFIPSTWKQWAADADGNGVADPYDIDDAALTAGYYLCANGRDLATGSGWWAAVLSYNHITKYAIRVYSESDRYGRQSIR